MKMNCEEKALSIISDINQAFFEVPVLTITGNTPIATIKAALLFCDGILDLFPEKVVDYGEDYRLTLVPNKHHLFYREVKNIIQSIKKPINKLQNGFDDVGEMEKKLDDALSNITPEEIAKFFHADTRQKGWVSIDEHLPMMYAADIAQGYTAYLVKDVDGKEFKSAVSDHSVWYYFAKDAGITHWWKE